MSKHWDAVHGRANHGEFDRPAEQPTAFPDELSVLRANITKLAAENARLEREVERLREASRASCKDCGMPGPFKDGLCDGCRSSIENQIEWNQIRHQ